jgi:predicted Rdx family selenoprotein
MPRSWSTERLENQVLVTLGAGNQVATEIGQPFAETVTRLAREANYGGAFRVFLNSVEILDPSNAPELIEIGQNIAICPYDKVGR